MEPQKLSPNDLKDVVLQRIALEGMSPRSAWFFSGKECLVWILWVFTVLLGATAVAVTLSIAVYRQYSFFEITHGSFFWFVLEVLPLLWLVIFTAMAILGVFNLRHTKHGYRYPLWQILGSSLAVSMVGGAGLHLLGVGFMLDEQIGRKVNLYESQIKMEQKMWQAPQAGRMVGSLILPGLEESSGGIVSFTDVGGVVWQINISELNEDEKSLLTTGRRVRLVGHTPEPEQSLFYVCGVFPWVYEKHYSAEELKEFKSLMQERMYRFAGLETLPEGLATSSRCANIPVVRVMQNKNLKSR